MNSCLGAGSNVSKTIRRMTLRAERLIEGRQQGSALGVRSHSRIHCLTETEQGVPTLARRGALSADDVRQFGDRYDRAYGDRALEGDRDYQVRHHADDLRFRRRRADDVAAAAAAAPVVTAQPPVRPVEREVVVHDSTRVERPADAPRVVEQRPGPGEEARTVNATLGGIAPAPIVVTSSGRAPTVVERHPRTADEVAADRAARQRELEAYDAERRRQVRYPTLNAPATTADAAPPRGRVIEEVVVRRREVGPDETETR